MNRDIAPQACRMGDGPDRKIGIRPHGPRAAPRHDGAMSDTFALKLRAWWHRDELDEQLEHGARPDGANAPLAYRAAQLRRRSTRERAGRGARGRGARGAQGVVGERAASAGARRRSAPAPYDLVALALRLRADEPIDVRGAAMVARLVFNGTSPLYGDTPVTLRYAARSARLALDPPAAVAARLELSEVA